MSFEKYFAHCVYNARKRAGLTQVQVANALSISLRWYQRIEHGDNLPGAVILIKIMLLLDIDINCFKKYL